MPRIIRDRYNELYAQIMPLGTLILGPARSRVNAGSHHGGETSCATRAALLRTLGLLIIPSAVDPPARERARPPGSRWSTPLDERFGRGWPGLLGLPGSMAGGMISPLSSRSQSAPPEAIRTNGSGGRRPDLAEWRRWPGGMLPPSASQAQAIP